MPDYTADPFRFDHELVIGDTYQPATVTLQDSAGTAHSLSGATGLCYLREEPGGEILLTPTVTVTNAANGIFTWSSTAAATAALVPGKARYGVRITFSGGEKRTIVEGYVTIRRGVLS